MEIREISSTPRQNFGALKIDKGADKALKRMSLKNLNSLIELGKEFENYEYCHLRINKIGQPIISLADGKAYRNIKLQHQLVREMLPMTAFEEINGKRKDKYSLKYFSLFFEQSEIAKLQFVFNDKTLSPLEKVAELVRALERQYQKKQLAGSVLHGTEGLSKQDKSDYLMNKYGLN